MEIIFIRHAKSINYENNIRQESTTKLGGLGKKQAYITAKILKKYFLKSKFNFKVILTSEWNRAIETSTILSRELKIPIETNNFIHEFVSSPLIASQPLNSEIVKKFNKEVSKYSHNFDWKFNNEGESTRDVINRGLKFKRNLITKYKDMDVIVVSHGFFITVFLTLILIGDKYEDSLFKHISDMFKFNNCSLTRLNYDIKTKKWKVSYINDSRFIINQQ